MSWIQLIFHSNQELAPRIENLLEEAGALSVTMADDADQPILEPELGTTPLWNNTRITGLFESGPDLESLARQLISKLDTDTQPDWEVQELEEQDWTRAWMDRFEPMQFGQRLWIVPSWYEAPNQEAVNILLDPGLAFGTGTHPTTRLCLEWLDSHDCAGKEVIDYGCGSGILAIAAAKLGAKRVMGVDNDPQALIATRENARVNGVDSRIQAYLPGQFPEEPADLLLANILAGPLVDLYPVLSRLVKPGGYIVLSGILQEQADALRESYQQGFELKPTTLLDEWVRVDGIRKSAA